MQCFFSATLRVPCAGPGVDGLKPQDGKTLENEIEVVEGMKFDRGYISPYFVTDAKTQMCEMENPLILIVEKKVWFIMQPLIVHTAFWNPQPVGSLVQMLWSKDVRVRTSWRAVDSNHDGAAPLSSDDL